MKKNDKVVIAWCDPGEVDGRFAADMMALAASRHDRLGPLIRNEGSGLLSRQRNEVVARFLDELSEPWLLMLDADLQVPVSVFDRICQTADAIERPVVSGLYFGAWSHELWITPIPVVFGALPDGTYLPAFEYPEDTVFEIDAAATGCLLVHRRVLERIRADAPPEVGPAWAWFADGPVNGRWISEDLIFSNRIKAAGFPIHCDSGAILAHHKRVWISDAHFRWLVSQLPDTTAEES